MQQSMDFSQLLLEKIDPIIQHWVEAVHQDPQIETANHLPYQGIRDSIPYILKAMATVLSDSQASDLQVIVQKSLEHGNLRAEQGFEPSEIAREYRLLRRIIFTTLEPDLIQSSSGELLDTVRVVNGVIDEAIACCFNSYTEARLQELDQLQKQLTLNNQELTRLVRANQENLSHLAHELKTPLTSIIGYSDLFLRQQRKQPQEKDALPNLEHIDRVLRGGRQLLQLINDALELSRYEAGKMQLHPSSTPVAEVMQTVVELVEPLVDGKEIQIHVDCDRAPQQVVTDTLRFQQIVTNLLSNAIRYTKAGSINIHCQTVSNHQWSVAVSDTGIGIAPEDQRQIFEPYFRTLPTVQTPNSTGLGLAIVARLVTLLQGTIEVVSEVGVGSTFTVTLPLTLSELGQQMHDG